jgi:hypothetical protein
LRSGEAEQSSVAVARRDYIQPIDEPVAPDRLGPAVTFATTEHFNLQTARVATISDANGRASIYFAALSSNLIALAFIGQMSRLGTAFRAFAGTVAISSSCLHVDLIARNAPSGSGRGGRTAAQSSTGRGTTSTSLAAAAGIPYTTVRPAIFSASLLAAGPEVRASRTWTGLADTGKVGFVDHRDVADVSVRILRDPAHGASTTT